MNPKRANGFTLLEVLIAVLIFSFGMLGLAVLQAQSIKVNQSANFRSQATALANVMLDSMRANRGNLGSFYSNPYNAPADDCPALPDGAAPADDVTAWRQLLSCELPQGVGAIAPLPAGTNQVAVCIRWSDSRLETGAAAGGADCVADAARFGAGASDDGTSNGSGAGVDGDSSVFVVVARL
ncbi:MAG TPA: type IV pilus modification protein PilV [Dokdonella sp.]